MVRFTIQPPQGCNSGDNGDRHENTKRDENWVPHVTAGETLLAKAFHRGNCTVIQQRVGLKLLPRFAGLIHVSGIGRERRRDAFGRADTLYSAPCVGKWRLKPGQSTVTVSVPPHLPIASA